MRSFVVTNKIYVQSFYFNNKQCPKLASKNINKRTMEQKTGEVLPRPRCFHNGIILIVNCFRIVMQC